MACGTCTSGGGCGCSTGDGGCATCPSVQVHDWLPASIYGAGDLVEVAFKGRRKATYRNARSLPITTGDYVVVAADSGIDCGYVTMAGELVRLRSKKATNYPVILRVAHLKDIERHEANRKAEEEAIRFSRHSAKRLKLKMKVVDAEWQFDRKRISFFFTAEKRVELGQLVRTLARRFHTRIDLKRINDREETARIGGIGSCGRELCCSSWMQKFKPVNTHAAKNQNLPLNPARITGKCGRLKCCLNYELEHYMSALKKFPRISSRLKTENGLGTVQKVDIFKNLVWVQYPDGNWEAMALKAVQPLTKKVADRPRKAQRMRKGPRGKNRKK